MQSEQLAYAIVTPYSMRKSRTGGIVGRLISRTGLDLVGGRMFAPGAELTKRYADTIVTETDPEPSRHAAIDSRVRAEKFHRGEKWSTSACFVSDLSRTGRGGKDSSRRGSHPDTSAPAAKRFVTPTVITSPMIQRMLFTSSREWSLNSNPARSSAI